jgi:Protein of unknown function (DUF4256)
MPKATPLTAKERTTLLRTLKERFEEHVGRHPGIEWSDVQARLERNEPKLLTLQQMEASGGEPDVVALDKATGEVTFVDCSPQSPKGRRSLCYDRDALEARKEHRPKSSAVETAASMGANLLTVEEYQDLQRVGEFDTTTSSWVQTPVAIRDLGGALFGDRRYNTIFVYHNGPAPFLCRLTTA